MILITFMAIWSSPAQAGREPAQKALEEKDTPPIQDVVQNRFFLKDGRFEIAGTGGYVPNNPMVSRISGGFMGAYHLSEKFAAEGSIMYFPDRSNNDLKSLTKELVNIASDRSGQSNFEQPVQKMMLGATFVARWSPIYGKINLLGESVLNFDLYFIGGLGMLSSKKYYAYSDSDTILLRFEGNEVTVPVNVGIGMDFFVTQSVAVKLDARSFLYRAAAPIYDPDDQEQLNRMRIYNDIVTSVGVSYFIPKMKPRLMDF
jgi:outer membrane beta-barrel protein